MSMQSVEMTKETAANMEGYMSVLLVDRFKLRFSTALLNLNPANRRPKNKIGFKGLFSDYTVRWLEVTFKEKKFKKSTYDSYYRKIHNHINPLLGSIEPYKLTKTDTDQFKEKLEEKGLAENTVIDIMRLLSTILNKACEEKVIAQREFSKCTGKSRRKKRKIVVLTRAAQYTLERTCEREKTGLLVLLALYTGMRVGEISALKWDDVDLDEGFVYVRETVQRIGKHDGSGDKTELSFDSPKSENSERAIPLSQTIVSHLKKNKEHADCEYVISCKNHIAEPRVCQYRFDTLLEKAGLKKVNFHALRHTFATRCMEEKMDIKTLSEILGHSDVKMTLEYGKSLTEHKKKAVMLLDKVNQAIAG